MCHITVKNTQWKYLGKHILFENFGTKIFPLSIQVLLYLFGDFFLMKKKML